MKGMGMGGSCTGRGPNAAEHTGSKAGGSGHRESAGAGGGGSGSGIWPEHALTCLRARQGRIELRRSVGDAVQEAVDVLRQHFGCHFELRLAGYCALHDARAQDLDWRQQAALGETGPH